MFLNETCVFSPPAVYPVLLEEVLVGALSPSSDLQTLEDARGTASLRPCTDPDHTHMCRNAYSDSYTPTEREHGLLRNTFKK